MKEKLKFIGGIIVIIAIVLGIGILVYNSVRAQKEGPVHPVATFDVEGHGTVKMELYPEYAPNTVANFVALIESGYYNNKGVFGKDDICVYMGQESSEDAKGPTISLLDSSVEAGSENDYSYEINGEFIANGFEQNTLRHEKGVVSLNRSDYSGYGLLEEGYNSGTANFSIMMQDAEELNGVYCGFGKITEGMEIIEKIYNEAQVKATEEAEETAIKEFASMPVITNATIEKFGAEFSKPDVHEAFDFQGYLTDLYSRYYSN